MSGPMWFFLKLSRAASHHDDITDHLKTWEPYSICHPESLPPLWWIFFFIPPLFIILVPYARSGLLNMCQTLFMRVKLLMRPGENPPLLSHTRIIWHEEALWAECPGRCGLSEPSCVTLDRNQESIHMRPGEGTAAILIFPASPRGGERSGGEAQDGDISATLQCIIKKWAIQDLLQIDCDLFRLQRGWWKHFQGRVCRPGLKPFKVCVNVFTYSRIRDRVAQVIQELHLTILLSRHLN